MLGRYLSYKISLKFYLPYRTGIKCMQHSEKGKMLRISMVAIPVYVSDEFNRLWHFKPHTLYASPVRDAWCKRLTVMMYK
jgi:hypothetical protein